MFELESLTKVKILDVRTLASKDRKPDEKPGAQLLIRAQLASDILAMFDGFLPGMKSTDIELTIEPPEVQEDLADEAVKPPKGRKPAAPAEKDATKQFIDRHAPVQ